MLRNGSGPWVTFENQKEMPKSRTKHPLLEGFGGVLKRLHETYEERLGRKISHDALARLISQRVAQLVSPSVTVGATTLWRWEAGEVAGPDPIILKQLCAVYGVDFNAMLAVLETNLKDSKLKVDDAMKVALGASDLLRHVTDPASTLHFGGHGVPASDSAAHARMLELESQLAEREAFIHQTQDAASALWAMYAERVLAAEEGRPARTAKRRRRSPHRKTG
jgi:transcriptional regulator with XRE-family HTH domain